MKSVKTATLVTVVVVALFLLNDKLIDFVVGRFGGPGVGVSLPGSVKFFVKLDHFFVDYFYVLIPFAWIVTFLPCVLVELSLWLLNPKKKPGEEGPIDS